jgi:hypothetical protein
MGESMTPEQEAVWNQYWSGLIDFPTFQATYPRGGVPDGVGQLGHGLERPWTKERTEFMEQLTKEIVGRIRSRL